ncbi:MAG: helix-turn-helix transcriptional regulator [Clostridia bacterium]|nr:helix-turn-helix transcriptional regulator [Clostridia bacterium]
MKKHTMGKLIAERRKELGLTQADLADKMGVTDKAVSKWERDLSYPDLSSLPKLAEIFEMSVDELMQIKHREVELLSVLTDNFLPLLC